MTKRQKKNLIRIIVALSLFLLVFSTNIILKEFRDYKYGISSIIDNKYGWLLTFSLYFLIYIYIGYDVLKKSFLNIIHLQPFDENLLMSVATIGAFMLGIYTGINKGNPDGFDEACAVLLFYQVGEWFQGYAVSKSRKNIKELMNIRPDYANLLKENNEIEVVDPSVIKVNDFILIKPGEKIPLDGVIVEGNSTLDTKALTGESLPRDVEVGDNVISGCVNIDSTIKVRVLKEFYDSTVSKILELVENASNKKSKSETFITKFSKYYTPIVVILALILAIFPPLISSDRGTFVVWSKWIYRALSFLVVSCPCALVISVPLSFFAGLGGASKNGILIKGSIYIEDFNKCSTFVFDKTGTLTKGNFKITNIYPSDNSDEILKYASIAELNSTHPIATSIKQAYGKDIDNNYSILNVQGKGIIATGKHKIICGNEKIMMDNNISFEKATEIGTIIHVAVDDNYLGFIVIADEIKEEAYDTVSYLKKNNRIIMLTGDNDKIASDVAQKLDIEYKSNLLPEDKVSEVSNLLNDNGKVCFVGDGINDAPVLMLSDIGISMGGVGSDAAIEASDIVLMHDDLKSIVAAKRICKKTMRIVYENILFALAVKVLILILSALGITNMWFAVFGDVGVAVICILNAMRCNVKKV